MIFCPLFLPKDKTDQLPEHYVFLIKRANNVHGMKTNKLWNLSLFVLTDE
jgi:hypothetical protein